MAEGDVHRKRLIAAFEDFQRVGADVVETIDTARRESARYVRYLRDGGALAALYSNRRSGERRDQMFEVLAEFDRTLTRTRAEAIRLMVDDEGMSLSEVARLVGRSRQFVTRLYRSAPADADEADRAGPGNRGR